DGKKQDHPTVVVRGGAGLFYDGYGEDLVLRAQRSNVSDRRYIVDDPATLDLFPTVPTEQALTAARAPRSTISPDPRLRLPTMLQSNIGFEKELPGKIVFSATYTNIRAWHSLRSRAVDPANRRFQYESTGRFSQDQLSMTVTRRLSR